ncbi:uncharacterized protein LOC113217962 [Frankliniella occidentalis]|uniref:Uncharacterized protein LOC113217962 n=1 Tax=Frankliniella occidentalis TaxID=133901 RepID=A0A6J1TKK4_FRAOC|nr:uncharacterized protein LOC113217962 [Frankliniella occidentalis]
MLFMDHLTPVLKSAFPDSAICKGVEMKRLKTTRVITNVIAATHKEDLSATLKNVKFSVLTDESTHFNVKTAAVAVRFHDRAAGRIVTKFWDLSDVFPKGDFEAAREGASADRLFQLLMNAFEKWDIPTENFIGFASDGASVMLGVNSSVMTRLQERCPGIVIMRCICHSLHLAAREAVKVLPKGLEDMARNIYSFFKHSSKRVAQFAEFQLFLEVAEHKMLSMSVTRWLCLRENVDRILEQWDALRLYLTQHRLDDNTHGTEMLFAWLNDPIMKAYYYFLAWVLPKISTMNAYFQHNKVVVTSLHEKMAEGFKELLQSYMKPTYLARTPLIELNPTQRDMFSPIANLYVGVQVAEQLKHNDITEEKREAFRIRCRDYMITLCNGIKSRFDFGDPLLLALPVLKPKIATNFQARPFTNSIVPFANLVPRAKPSDPKKLQELDDQWRRLPLDDDVKDLLGEEEIDVFWHKVGQLTDCEGSPKYAILSDFAMAVLSLPHSNADVERIFSKVTLTRTKMRNRLITPTVEGLCLASEHVKSTPQCCQSFEPTDKMFNCMTSETLYGSKKAGDATAEREGAPNGREERGEGEADDPHPNDDHYWEITETFFD